MARCPECDTPGAYIGWRDIECKNSKCKHFKITEEPICPCYGVAGHKQNTGSVSSDSIVDGYSTDVDADENYHGYYRD